MPHAYNRAAAHLHECMRDDVLVEAASLLLLLLLLQLRGHHDVIGCRIQLLYWLLLLGGPLLPAFHLLIQVILLLQEQNQGSHQGFTP